MTSDFASVVSVADDQIDLARAALLCARDAYPDLDPDAYLGQLDAWADAIRPAIESRQSDPPFETLNDLLFDQLGFRGNEADYYDPRNSYLNQVVERRTGLPITLSMIYLEIGWRVGLPLSGVGLPGHFIVRCDFDGRVWFIDPFHRGDLLSEDDCIRLALRATGGLTISRVALEAITRRQILVRMLSNLRATYIQRDMLVEARAVTERLIETDPVSPTYVRDLGLIHFQLGAYRRAAEMLQAYITLLPNAHDMQEVRQVINAARAEMARWN